MNGKKKKTCELNSHLHEEEEEDGKDESPSEVEPDASDIKAPNSIGESKVRADSDKNGVLRTNSESEFRDSVHYLDSVLEYASKIRAFVGLDEDDEPPPPLPTSNPLDIIAANNPSENISSGSVDSGDSDRGLSETTVPEYTKPDIPRDMDNELVGNTPTKPDLTNVFENSEVMKKVIVVSGAKDDLQESESLKNEVSSITPNEISDKFPIDVEINTKEEKEVEQIPVNSLHELPEDQVACNKKVIADENLEEDPMKEMSNDVPNDMTSDRLEAFDSEKNISKNNENENSVKSKSSAEDVNKTALVNNREDTEKGIAGDNQCEGLRLDDTDMDRQTPEMFSFDPEYVKGLQQEDASMKAEGHPTPSRAVLRRLSTEIVRKVLDDAGHQIQEILDERRKSSLAQTELVETAGQLMCLSSPHNTMNPEADDGRAEAEVEVNRETSENNVSNNASENNTNHEKPPGDQPFENEIQLKDVLAKTYGFDDFKRKIEQEMNQFDPQYDVDPDTVCGIGSFRPKWLQRWATARAYLVLYSIIGTLSGSYYTYLIGTITTLEKRFAFDSKITGTIMMVDEITPLFLGTLIGYFGGKAHRPRMVGFGMLLSALCCFISAAPYFIYGPAKHLNIQNVNNANNLEMCDGKIHDQNCWSDDRPPTLTAILLLILGSFLKGFGNLAYYAVGFAYMDDNLKKKNAPMYYATAMALRLVGPVIGFLMSSAFLKYPENPFDNPEYGPEDPRWIGGWWIGFVVQGFLLIVFSILISLFPRKLPGKKPIQHSADASKKEKDIIHNVAGLFSALKRLAVNPIFVLYVINCNVSAFGVFGHYVMLPKYMEHQFRLSASDASLLSGPPALVSIIVSIIIGGYIIWKLRPSAKAITAGIAVLQAIASVGYLMLMIPRCDRVQMMNFGVNDKGLNLQDACNTDCNCSTTAFTPVCGPDGKSVYFSPCHAGCGGSFEKTYFNCSCIEASAAQGGDSAAHGFCADEACWFQALAYIIFLPFLELIINSLRVGFSMVLLRSVLPEDKSVTLGTFEMFICAFTFLPFPIVFGALIDSCCLVWEESCQKTGNCWFYDTEKFNYYLHGVPAAGCFIATFCMAVICCLSGRVRDLYEEDDDQDLGTREKNVTTSAYRDKTTNIEMS